MASYHDQLKALAESIGSDGCSHVIDICIECCWEHDWTYRTGMTPRGVAANKEYADMRFRDCIQAHMSLRWFSPISWIRWIAVVKFGKGIWNKNLINPAKVRMLMDYSAEAKNSRDRILMELGYAYSNR